MARVQMRNPGEGRTYYDRKRADGKGPMEAMRCVKRRLSDIVFQQMLNDAIAHSVTGPGGQQGNDSDSSVTDSHPNAGSSDKPLPGPAKPPAQDPAAEGRLTQKGAMCGWLLAVCRIRLMA